MNLTKDSLSEFQFGWHHLIIPDILAAHFHVIDIAEDFQSSNAITAVGYYDSLNRANQTDTC